MSTPNAQHTPKFQFATHDMEEFAERMSVIAPGICCSPHHGTEASTTVNAVKLPGVGIFRSELTNFRVFSESRDFFTVTIPLTGSAEYHAENGKQYSYGDTVYVSYPDLVFDCRIGESTFDNLVVVFERSALRRFASRLGGNEAMRPTSIDLSKCGRAGVSFIRQARFVWDELMCGGSITKSPLVQTETSNLLQALFVEAAAPELEQVKSGIGRTNAAHVKRAEEFLVANLCEPLSLADVAAESGANIRTLSRGFRERHGIGVMTFLRHRRLEAVNRVLRTAERGETNVSEVALRFGFGHFGRFSAYYREMFGELPSETLAK